MIKNFCIKLIKLYQATISPDHGVYKNIPFYGCKFYPSCSEYAIECLQRKPLHVALFQAIWRIMRCNPWSVGGYDPVANDQVDPLKSRSRATQKPLN